MFSRFSILIVCLCCVYVTAKLCPSMDIRSYLRNFEKLRNCTKIVGFLKLVLFKNETSSPYYSRLNGNYPSFPELKEVTGYVIVFNVPNLYDLGLLFPNLILIRGRKLLDGNSLMIHHNNQIEKIGLSNLRQIQRGNVEIGKCPNLCYVNTVNWTALGTSLVNYAELAKCEHEECAPDCQGQCWAPGRCQKQSENCHPECLGCGKPGSPKHCLVCKNWKDGNTCVSQCPMNKLISEELMECLTKEECRNLKLPQKYWIFDQWCLPEKTCPENYEYLNSSNNCKMCDEFCNKTCEGMKVETKSQLKELQGCTHITGDLELRIKDEYMNDLLAENLGQIKEIDGCLKIARSDALTSLQFMKHLRRIGGIDKHKQCNNYTVYIFENANLQNLIDVSKIETTEDVNIGFHMNPELCIAEIRRFAASLGITNDNFNEILRVGKDVPPSSNGGKAQCSDFVMNVTIIENNPRNITLMWMPLDSSNIIGYTVYYIRASNADSMSNDMCSDDGWNSRFVSKNTIQLTKLAPFSTYTYWIRIYHMSGEGGSTEKKNFTTLPDNPTEPLSFETTVSSPTSINLTWNYPEHPNGNLSHYQLTAFIEEDDSEFIRRRNYCLNPHDVEKVEPKELKRIRKTVNHTLDKSCKCDKNTPVMNETICDTSDFTGVFHSKECSRFMYDLLETQKDQINLITHSRNRTRFQSNAPIIDIKLPAEDTNYILKNLTPFTTYVILFSACNVEFRNKPQCSAVLFSSQRTKENITADLVSELKVKVRKDDVVSISWLDPSHPNGMIVAYNIEYKSADGSQSIHVPDCVTRTQHIMNHFKYEIKGIDPGLYSLRVRPVSLFGPGIYSKPIRFQIATPVKSWVIYLFVCIVLIIVIILIFIYLWFKKQSKFDRVYLITNINPDYQTVIIEPEWELDRNDIEIENLLGQGTFGQVFRGVIKSKQLPCAVKTASDSSSVSYRTEFLKEGYVMKSFSEAHHVVKLFGVVSTDGPPLVIMELMERGDLKKYLRQARDSSGISSPEMYQMSAQIADGMAYLSAKKFVHRDLAARNCMVAADRTVKIGDFGMTKDVYETDYYRKGEKELLPIRWMSPESLRDGMYSSESDVWSYGIVLWEMVTLAEHPYQGMSNDQVLNFVTSRGRLGRPPQCPDVLWEIMEVCWRTRPKDRPLFLGIVEKLEHLVGPSFALVSFYHSRAGCEYRMNYRRHAESEAATNDFISSQDLYEHNSYPHEDDNTMLMPEDQDFLPSSTRIFRRNVTHNDSSWSSPRSISNSLS